MELLRGRGVLTSILSLGMYSSMEFMVSTWGATYLVNIYALSPDEAARRISLYYAGIMLGRLFAGFLALKLSDKALIRCGIGVSFLGILWLLLPLGSLSVWGLLLIGMGFGPIFPSVLHSVPARFGAAYAADLTGYHMSGAYAIGFCAQLIFGYVASATSFYILPFVLLGLCVLLFLLNEQTLRLVTGKKERQR